MEGEGSPFPATRVAHRGGGRPELFPFETLRLPNLTASRFAEKRCFSVWFGAGDAVRRLLAYCLFQRQRALDVVFR